VASIADQLGSEREARWIVEHAGPDGARPLADRRATGEPLQYVLGRWPFRTLELRVDRRALIPRPETEQVVEVALGEFRKSAGRTVAVDLGTGSGAIALALAVEGGAGRPGLEVWATDDSAEALALARENLAEVEKVDPVAAARVRPAPGRWFEALPPGLAGRVDLVVANPPYVAAGEYPAIDPTVRGWEPRRALVAADGTEGTPGFADIEAIVADAPRWLAPGGVLVVEIAPAQATASRAAARRVGFGRVTTGFDLAGRPRMLVAGR
jgi:release factor glutamine methyltransferase